MKTKFFLLTALIAKVFSMTIPVNDENNIQLDGLNDRSSSSGGKAGMVIYLPNYTLESSSSNVSLKNYDLTNVDVVNYCFYRLDNNGAAYSSYEKKGLDKEYMTYLNNDVKKKYPKLRTVISFGGGSGSNNFATAFSTDDKIKYAAKNITKIVNDYKFDGVDIDWEFPENDSECEKLVTLLKKIRYYLGDNKLITLSSSATASKYRGYLSKYVKYLDWFNIMTYNYAGSWNKYSGHNAPLYTFKNDLNKQKSVNTTVSDYVAAGVPESMIVIGGAFNGKEWKVTSSSNNGLNQSGSYVNTRTYRYLRENNILSAAKTAVSPWVRTWHSDVKSPTLYNTKTKQYISYDDNDAMCERAAYAKKRKLAGFMVWEVGQDYKRELIDSSVYCYRKY